MLTDTMKIQKTKVVFGLLIKDGVRFKLTKASGRIIGALDSTCRNLKMDLTITCGAEAHPDQDPHTLGEAFDIRTHDIEDEVTKRALIRIILSYLQDGNSDIIAEVGTGLATFRFYAQLEFLGTPSEHIHIQRRKGATYS